ncbi:hypothetical protein H3T59_07825 [Commensalibacter sp. M0357]|nr:hypothetical protein [Commensalibacter sp. M0357]
MKPIILLAAVFLAACSSSPRVVYRIECPPLRDYTSQSQEKLSSEIKALKPDSEIIRYLLDYKSLRDMIMACQNTRDTSHR